MSAEVVIIRNVLPTITHRFPGAVDAVLSAGTERMAEFAETHHPWQNRTGETEASIHSEQTGDHEFAFIGGGAMVWLEWGTINMPPFPTMQPAYDAVEPSVEDGLSRLAEKLV
jgi:HK97 gp10 family phage protein